MPIDISPGRRRVAIRNCPLRPATLRPVPGLRAAAFDSVPGEDEELDDEEVPAGFAGKLSGAPELAWSDVFAIVFLPDYLRPLITCRR
jgi:hypothetical protein